MLNPYIVGIAVIGARFYGREALIDQVLTSRREHFCLMGNRRIGKTSFLRHLEFLVQQDYPNLIGLYWDLQSCLLEEDLIEQLKNGLLDAEAQLDDIGIDYDQLEESEDLFVMMQLLKRGVIAANKKLLLLVDEAESLIDVGRTDKKLLENLRLVMQDSTFVRTTLCAARHLSEVNQIDSGGPRFLNGFEPVLFVSSLRDVDADALIDQSHTGGGLQVSDEIATKIKEKTNRHPYLIQSLCAYLYDHEMNLPKACDYVMQQGMAEKAFADDYRYLAPVGENDKGLLGKLRSVMQEATFTRTIVCGSRRLSEVSRIELVGSDFLDGFEPVLFVSSIDEADVDALMAQSHTGQGLQVSDEMSADIKEKTNCHPYLIQSICLYLYDHEMDVEKAYDYVMQQGMAEKAFADDFRYLAPIEKDILMQIYRVGNATLSQIQQKVYLDADTIKQFLFILEACGYIKLEGSSYHLANYFFARWLRSNESRLDEIASVVSDAAMQDIETQPITNYLTEAIAVIDLYDSSPLANRYGANFLMEVLGVLREMVLPIYQIHNGQFIRSKGDDFLMTFPTPQDAIEAVTEVLKQVEGYNENPKSGVPIDLHIGVHFGETRVGWENDRYGDAVNRAFRIASIQPADMIEIEVGLSKTQLPTKNAILITEHVYEAIKEVKEMQCRLIGLFKLRGIAERHMIYEVLRDDE